MPERCGFLSAAMRGMHLESVSCSSRCITQFIRETTRRSARSRDFCERRPDPSLGVDPRSNGDERHGYTSKRNAKQLSDSRLVQDWRGACSDGNSAAFFRVRWGHWAAPDKQRGPYGRRGTGPDQSTFASVILAATAGGWKRAREAEV
jgi:hypothetical protein